MYQIWLIYLYTYIFNNEIIVFKLSINYTLLISIGWTFCLEITHNTPSKLSIAMNKEKHNTISFWYTIDRLTRRLRTELGRYLKWIRDDRLNNNSGEMTKSCKKYCNQIMYTSILLCYTYRDEDTTISLERQFKCTT